MIIQSRGHRAEEEQDDLFARLLPDEAIASMNDAPDGSEMKRLVQDAAAKAETRDQAKARVEVLQRHLAKAEQSRAKADRADNFAVVAAAQAGICSLPKHRPHREWLSRFGTDRRPSPPPSGAISGLRQMIATGTSRSRYERRGPYCWATLRELFDCGPGPRFAVGPGRRVRS